MSRQDERHKPSAPKSDGEPQSRGLLQRLKRYAKDAVVAGTSTHGGVAGGVGGRKARKDR